MLLNLEILTASIVLNSFWKQSSLAATSVTSALEVIFNEMRYINLRTYLLTYLLTCQLGRCMATLYFGQQVLCAKRRQITIPALVSTELNYRLQSRGLEPLTAGLQSLRLASRLKPWLRTIDGLRWLMAATTAYGYKQEN